MIFAAARANPVQETARENAGSRAAIILKVHNCAVIFCLSFLGFLYLLRHNWYGFFKKFKFVFCWQLWFRTVNLKFTGRLIKKLFLKLANIARYLKEPVQKSLETVFIEQRATEGNFLNFYSLQQEGLDLTCSWCCCCCIVVFVVAVLLMFLFILLLLCCFCCCFCCCFNYQSILFPISSIFWYFLIYPLLRKHNIFLVTQNTKHSS